MYLNIYRNIRNYDLAATILDHFLNCFI